MVLKLHDHAGPFKDQLVANRRLQHMRVGVDPRLEIEWTPAADKAHARDSLLGGL
jgi:hypothetical protein